MLPSLRPDPDARAIRGPSGTAWPVLSEVSTMGGPRTTQTLPAHVPHPLRSRVRGSVEVVFLPAGAAVGSVAAVESGAHVGQLEPPHVRGLCSGPGDELGTDGVHHAAVDPSEANAVCSSEQCDTKGPHDKPLAGRGVLPRQ